MEERIFEGKVCKRQTAGERGKLLTESGFLKETINREKH